MSSPCCLRGWACRSVRTMLSSILAAKCWTARSPPGLQSSSWRARATTYSSLSSSSYLRWLCSPSGACACVCVCAPVRVCMGARVFVYNASILGNWRPPGQATADLLKPLHLKPLCMKQLRVWPLRLRLLQ